MKTLSILFGSLAVLLSDIMCAVVAYSYCTLKWGGQYACYSAPASTAFLLAIPYGIGIIICTLLAVFFYKKHRRNQNPVQ